MTEQEAIGYMNSVFDEYFGDRCVSNTNKFAMAQDMAIKALEKQIPKEPLDFGDESYLCPYCKRNNFYKGEYLDKQNYCDYCGQAIKWT